MTSKNRKAITGILRFLGFTVLLFSSVSARAQTVIATVPVGTHPSAVALNPVTNKIYVANCIPSGAGTGTPGTVTVIDGETNTTITVAAGVCPTAVAVDPVTNKIYVANFGHISLTCGSCFNNGSITVIDGVTNSTVTITDPNAKFPVSVAVNSTTNQIYVANNFTDNVTVIDGATNAITDVSTVGRFPWDIAVNPMTNKIYVTSFNPTAAGTTTTVTVIDGTTRNSAGITDPKAVNPIAVAVNPLTNKIYVANGGDGGVTSRGSVTVIDGATNSTTNIVDPNAFGPGAVAVNSVTNKIYVANANTSTMSDVGSATVIDGATNSFATVEAGSFPRFVAVNEVTNKIYVTNHGSLQDGGSNPGSVTVIDGSINSTITVIDPNAKTPTAAAIDPATDRIYVANADTNNVTVIDGGGTPANFTLSVARTGSGTGTVMSNPAGIDCGISCSGSFVAGTTVTLTASLASGSTFSGWSGACSGAGACSLTMTVNESVTATFSLLPPDFSLMPASVSLTAQRGGQATDVITVAPLNGGSFASAIQLSCAVTGPAPMPTCALSPSSVTPAANPVSSTLTITAPGLAAQLTPSSRGWHSGSLYALVLSLPGLVLLGFGRAFGKSRERRRQHWLLCGLFIAFIALQAGCGAGSNSQQIQPQNYTVTVTATSGAIAHTTQVAVTIP